MRASRTLSLAITVLASATLVGCGGGSGGGGDGGDGDGGGGNGRGGGGNANGASGQRLSAAEYQLLVRHHREAKALPGTDDASEAATTELLTKGRRQCTELASSGPVLRATAPGCRQLLSALESFAEAGAALERCAGDDESCNDRGFKRLIGSFDGLLTGSESVARAVDDVRTSDACREVLRGGKDFVGSVRRLRDAGRELTAAGDELGAAQDDTAMTAATTRLQQANERFAAESTAFERANADLEAQDPKPCQADVATS